jgi:hypothetical protein
MSSCGFLGAWGPGPGMYSMGAYAGLPERLVWFGLPERLVLPGSLAKLAWIFVGGCGSVLRTLLWREIINMVEFASCDKK